MISLKTMCLASLVCSTAVAFSLQVAEHGPHHDCNGDNDHREYLSHWNIDKEYCDGHPKHIDHHYDHYHYDHLDTHKIHAHLHKNQHKLEKIHSLLKHNNMHNHKQDMMLKENRDLINKQISLQKEDASRDEVTSKKLDKAVVQRKDIRNAVDTNEKLLNDVKVGQGVMMMNQSVVDQKLDGVSKNVYKTKHLVKENGDSLDNLHSKVDAQHAALEMHDTRLQKHMKDHKAHDKKMDKFIDMHKQHDARQSEMMGQVMVNQAKLNKIKHGQIKTQNMIAQHDENVKQHADNMNDFKESQMAFNDQAAAQMAKADQHMNKEKKHMMTQKDHMDMEKHHMKMEALHMADSEDYYNRAKHHHHHYKKYYNYKPNTVRMARHAPAILVGDSKA